jgi:hypothetical protein
MATATNLRRDFDLHANERKIEQSCEPLFKANPTLGAVNIQWTKGKPSIVGAFTESSTESSKRLMNKVSASGVVSFADDVQGIATVYRAKIKGHDTNVLVW